MEGACRRCNLCSVALSFLAQLYSTAAGIAVLGATYVLLCNCKGLQREILLLCIALLVRVEMIKYSNSRNGATPLFFSINVQHLSHRFALVQRCQRLKHRWERLPKTLKIAFTGELLHIYGRVA